MSAIASKLSPPITSMIRLDHTHAVSVFHQYTQYKTPRTRQALAETLCLALEIHAQLEEEIFYPAMQRVEQDEPVLKKSVPEHDEMRRLIGDNADEDTLARAAFACADRLAGSARAAVASGATTLEEALRVTREDDGHATPAADASHAGV